MRKVVHKDSFQEVELKSIRINKIYAYTTHSNLFILSKLGNTTGISTYGKYHFGFVNISNNYNAPSFCDDYAMGSISKALNSGRGVLEFNNLGELIEWKTPKQNKK